MKEEIKEHDSNDPNWINELPLDEFPFEDFDLTDVLKQRKKENQSQNLKFNKKKGA